MAHLMAQASTPSQPQVQHTPMASPTKPSPTKASVSRAATTQPIMARSSQKSPPAVPPFPKGPWSYPSPPSPVISEDPPTDPDDYDPDGYWDEDQWWEGGKKEMKRRIPNTTRKSILPLSALAAEVHTKQWIARQFSRTVDAHLHETRRQQNQEHQAWFPPLIASA